MTQAPSKATELNAEQQIALALIAEVCGRPDISAIEYCFNDGEEIFVVNIIRSPIKPNEPKGLYVSLGPPGQSLRML